MLLEFLVVLCTKLYFKDLYSIFLGKMSWDIFQHVSAFFAGHVVYTFLMYSKSN